MHRREFLKKLASGMAAGWAFSRWPGAFSISGEFAAPSNLIIACLADPHLRDGNDKRPEAFSLARAVAEIRALNPAPHLVFFAGDLAHNRDPKALALGEEILAELPMPALAVRGEGDGLPQKGGAGWRLFEEGRFFHHYHGVNLLGLDTAWQDRPEGPGFALGQAQKTWLDRVLSGLDPATPLLIISHAPLTPIYRPWGQWTVDSGPLLDHLSRFPHVLCLHGHVHQSGYAFFEGEAVPGKASPPLTRGGWGQGEISQKSGQSLAPITPFPTLPSQGTGRENAARQGLKNVSLPATSWPLPVALEGTPRKLQPGVGPRGCGWAFLPSGGQAPQLRQVLWQA